MPLGFWDPLHSSPLICRSRTSERVTLDFDLPLSVPDYLTCKLLWEERQNSCDHHCQQCWHLRTGCCCIWQQSHNYRKHDTSLILRGDQHYLLTENIVYFPSPKDAIFIKPESLWVQLENSWVHSVSLVTQPFSQPSHTIYTNWWKTSIPILVLPWGIFHTFTSERYIMVRAIGGDQDSLWNVNDTLNDIWHQCQGLYHWVTEGGDCMNPDICTESQVVL